MRRSASDRDLACFVQNPYHAVVRYALALFLTMSLLGLSVSSAADNPIVGKWDCVSKDVSTAEMRWTLVVVENGGKLSGSLNGGQEEIPLIEPKFDGERFTFKINVNPNCMVEAKVTVTGNKFDGTFGCKEAATVGGLRHVDVAAALKCPQSVISKYESGERLELHDVCRVPGISLAEFAPVRGGGGGQGSTPSTQRQKPRRTAQPDSAR